MTRPRTPAQPPAEEGLQANLTAAWDRAYPIFKQRVGGIDRAIQELYVERPDGKKVENGCTSAHKLAGVLGTFGLARGTRLARELETRLQMAGQEPAQVERLTELAAELRTVIEGAHEKPHRH